MPTATIERETVSLAALVNAAFAADDSARPCFHWTACGRHAAVEKAGRSLCRECAAGVRGVEYPLRHPSNESLYASDRLAAEALDMLEEQPDPDRAASPFAEQDSDDSQAS